MGYFVWVVSNGGQTRDDPLSGLIGWADFLPLIVGISKFLCRAQTLGASGEISQFQK
jgi:hypothetical protein